MTDETPRPDAGPQKNPVTIYRGEDIKDADETRAAADRDARRADREAKRAAPDAKRVAPAPPVSAPDAKRVAPAPPRAPRKRSGNGGRIAAAGIGIAAMAGLVANMEVSAGRAQAATKVSTASLVTQHAAKNPHQGAVLGNLAVAAAKKPIVLTPHAVVNTVSAPASSGGSYSAASYSAAPAAAPVASSGGSKP